MQSALITLVLAQLALADPAGGLAVIERRATQCGAREAAAIAPAPAPASRAFATSLRTACDERVLRPHVRGPRWQDEPGDQWFAVDKVQHFAMAYGTAMFGYGVVRGAGVSHGGAQTAALVGSLAAGIGKEVFDRSRGGPFSLKDLTWDALGTVAAWGLLSLNR